MLYGVYEVIRECSGLKREVCLGLYENTVQAQSVMMQLSGTFFGSVFEVREEGGERAKEYLRRKRAEEEKLAEYIESVLSRGKQS